MKAILAEKIEKPLQREALQHFNLKLVEEIKELDVKLKKTVFTSGEARVSRNEGRSKTVAW